MESLERGGLSRDGKWFTDEWTEGLRFSVRVEEVLRDLESPFQHLLVLRTESLGRMLVLDGNIQVSEADEAAYHELIVHPGLCRAEAPRSHDKKVLIIGGGDGGAAREVLRHPSVSRVDLVDIDPEVTKASSELLPRIWRMPHGDGPLHDDQRLTVRNEDGLEFLETGDDVPSGGYDLVVVDATDPIGPGAVLFSDRFYEAVRSRVATGGAMTAQAGSWWCLPEVLRTAHRRIGRAFGRAEAYSCWSAIYPGGLWNLVIGTFGDDPAKVDQRAAEQLEGCRFYDASIHTSAFALTPKAREVLRGDSSRDDRVRRGE